MGMRRVARPEHDAKGVRTAKDTPFEDSGRATRRSENQRVTDH